MYVQIDCFTRGTRKPMEKQRSSSQTKIGTPLVWLPKSQVFDGKKLGGGPLVESHPAQAKACCVYGGTPWEQQAALLEADAFKKSACRMKPKQKRHEMASRPSKSIVTIVDWMFYHQ